MAKNRLFLIDGHALCYRSFYAIRELSTSKGQPTNAILGFLNILRKLLRVYSPEYIAVCFDSKKKTYRQEKFAEYKIQRPKMPEPLIEQIPIIKEIVQAYNLSIFEFAGFEADDIIATLAGQATEKNLDVVVVSDDKDMYQLASEDISFYNSRKDALLTYDDIKEKLGFIPNQIADFIGLAGDKSDNIPGVMGIGKVTAQNLINEFGGLENIYKNLDKIKSASVKEKMLSQKDKAFLSKELAVLETKVPFNLDLSQLKVESPDNKRLLTLFRDLEFKKFAQEVAGGEEKQETKTSIKVLSNKKELCSLVENVKAKGKFSFLLDLSDEDLFSQDPFKGILFSLGEEKTYYVPFVHLKDIQEVFRLKKVVKITYDIKSSLKKLSQAGHLSVMVPFIDHEKDSDGTVVKVKNTQKKASVEQVANEYFVQESTFDVMLAAYVLSPTQSSNHIDSLAWAYLKSSTDGKNQLAKEVHSLYMLYPLMETELKARKLDKLFNDIEMPLAYVLFGIENHGVKLDQKHLKDLSVVCEKRISELTKSLFAMAGEEFNLNSPKQLGAILFDKMKLPALKKTKTGYSTNEEVLTKLSQTHEFPGFVLEYRKLAKLKSTYIDALPKLVSEETGRLHAHFNQTGTETGRLSSSNPNLQNIPIRTEMGRQIRKAIIPSEKNLLLMKADYSQVELRILAHLAQDENMMKAFQEEEDIHQYTASLVLGVPEEDITAEMRDRAKRVNFGIIYGMSAFGLAKDLNISNVEAQEFIDTYFLRYPKVKAFMDQSVKDCEESGYAVTLLNRRRYIPEINSRNNAVKQFAQRQAINTPVQGSAADLMKISMINVQEQMTIRKMKSRMLITVHDELVFDIEKKEKKLMVDLVREEMENPLELSVPIKVDIKIGKNWLEMDEV
jgi:DNA polymerase-1